jgi:hypothetical protein
MPSFCRSVLVATFGGLMLVACQVNIRQPAAPGQVALQKGDVSADLRRCPGSGSVDGYLKRLAAHDRQGHATVQQGWRQLQAVGAVEGALTMYAGSPQDCQRQPGAGATRSATTLVARFDTDGAAASAYPKGAMGFPTPAQDEEEPGLEQGIATQLTENSWLLERQVGGHTLAVAYWQRNIYTIFFIGVDLDTVEVSRALVAVDGRAG